MAAMRKLAWLSLCVLAVGCGDSHDILQPLDLAGGTGLPGDGAVFDAQPSLDGPVLTGDFTMDVDGPMITLLSPMQNDEVSGDTLNVTAKIVAKTGSIAGNTVQIIIPSSLGTTDTASMSLTSVPDVYYGTIDISKIPTGMSNFVVSASDTMGRTGSLTGNYVHDRGPQLKFVLPTQGATARGSVDVEITVDDPLHPVTDITKVKATVRMVDMKLTEKNPGAVPFRVVGKLDFSTYQPPLDGMQLIFAQATNSKGTVGKKTQQFTVDNAGPTIMSVLPMPNSVAGGIINVEAVIIDKLSGVVDSSVIAVFAGDLATAIKLDRVGNTNTFQGVFDVRAFGRGYYLPSISIRADDKLGNHGELGREIFIDLTPPQMELDPPKMRVSKKPTSGTGRECSILFDPVGDESASDGQITQQVFAVKARIQDRSNHPSGVVVEHYAGLDTSSLAMYALPAKTGGVDQALIVDTDNDGFCDAMNPLLVPVSTPATAANEALALAMAPLVAVGPGPDYSEFDASPMSPGPPVCTVIGEPAFTAPVKMCPFAGTSLTFALPSTDTLVGKVQVFSIPPVAADDFNCTGVPLDSLNHLPEGPTCLAAKASDIVGNSNVTPAIRVCINRNGKGDASGACTGWTAATYPNCTGTYNKITNTVDTTKHCLPLTLTVPPQTAPYFDTRFSTEDVLPLD